MMPPLTSMLKSEKYNNGVGHTPTSTTLMPVVIIPSINLLQSFSECSLTSLPIAIFNSPASSGDMSLDSRRFTAKAQPIRRAASSVRSSPTTPLISYSLKILDEIIVQLLLSLIQLRILHSPYENPAIEHPTVGTNLQVCPGLPIGPT